MTLNSVFKILAVCAATAVLMSTADARGSSENGKVLVDKLQCAACHGSAFNNPIDDAYPKLAGQHYDYLVHALMAYHSSTNPMMGRQNAIMVGQVQPLSEDDMKDIASYLSSLPASVITHK